MKANQELQECYKHRDSQTTDWKTHKQTAEHRTSKASENLFSGDAHGFQTSELSFVDQGQVTIILDCPVTFEHNSRMT